MKPVPWFVSCAIAGSVLVGAAPAFAQPPHPSPVAPAGTTLRQAFEAAWQRAVQSRESEAQTERARAEQTAAGSLWAAPPAVELNHLSDRVHSNAGRKETEIGIVWPLWLPGQRGARGVAADAEMKLAHAQTQAARLRVAGLVREAFWKLSAAQAEAASTAAQTRYLQGIASDVQRRVQAGDMARADALSARAELLEAGSIQGEADQRRLAALAQWRTLTGMESMPQLLAPSRAGLADPALPADEHPELRVAEQAVERALKRLDAVNLSRRDPPELSVKYREESPGYGEAPQRGIGIGLRIPFGTDGRNAPLQAAALGELDVAQATQQRLRERHEADLALARGALQSAVRQLDDTRDRAGLLRERAELIGASFRAGETSLSDLLRAANAAAQSDAALARQQAALGLAQAQLQQALGILP
ncbi:TolC family protein [Variovorax paradoxus]|uniref:Outer membrane efflux protein n=1 Tax=Variovorax paradoxus TaxID=34073 RepID=A0A0H2M5K2_VARPD|nr:TolC family protein [Variovorax paradoxus]KLN57406.1 outer membrane efflux protein [Variovorax paradoxus]